MRKCHYEILDIDASASVADIRKAYRKKALELHPDKNMDRVAQATAAFALVQEAHEVLSDPAERSWYDAHKEAILSGRSTSDGIYYSGTDAAALMTFFSSGVWTSYDDSPNGFYTVFRDLFHSLEEEELKAAEKDSILDDFFTSFGTKSSVFDEPFPQNGRFLTPREFYTKWLNFVTFKSFAWHDKYKLSDAPDRRIRRAMEKENKKLRDSARREFNETVRNLAAFVRKRDPRVKAYETRKREDAEVKQSEIKEKQRIAKVERLKEAGDFQEQEWAKVDTAREAEMLKYQMEEEVVEEEPYCVACDKFFRTEKQLKNHEQSKKHLIELEKLRQEILAEEEAWKSDSDKISGSGKTSGADDASDEADEVDDWIAVESEVNVGIDEEDTDECKSVIEINRDEVDEEELVALIGVVNRTSIGLEDLDGVNEEGEEEGVIKAENCDTDDDKGKQNDKKKKKKKKDKGKKLKAVVDEKQTCNICGISFQSRSKLFEHLKVSGHAVNLPTTNHSRKQDKDKEKGNK